jgi:hypothetical protein
MQQADYEKESSIIQVAAFGKKGTIVINEMPFQFEIFCEHRRNNREAKKTKTNLPPGLPDGLLSNQKSKFG